MADTPGIVPHLTVDGGAAAIAFYIAAFGAEEIRRQATKDGRLMHAEIRVNGGLLFLNDAFPEHDGVKSPNTMGGTAVTLHLETPEPDALFNRAVAAGATVSFPLQDMFWGSRYGQVTDPFGHRWSIASPPKPITQGEIDAGAKEHFG